MKERDKSIDVRTFPASRQKDGPFSFNSMEQSLFWKASSHLASQEIARLLWNSNCDLKSPPLFPILIQMNSVHDFLPCFS